MFIFVQKTCLILSTYFVFRLGQYYFVGFLGSVWVSYNLLWSCAGYGTSERFSNTVAYLGGPGSGDVGRLHDDVMIRKKEIYFAL